MRFFTLAAIVTLIFGQIAIADDIFIRVHQDASLPLYTEARDLMMAGKYMEAAAKFEALVINFPDSTRASYSEYYLGYCWEQGGNKVKAFKQYRKALDSYPTFPLSRSFFNRCVNLAKELWQKEGDVYDQYLKSTLRGRHVSSEESRRFSAFCMAEMGNWSGIDLLIEGLDEGSTIEQFRISELLGQRMDLAKVRDALSRALANSRNEEIVRLNALRSLSRYANEGKVQNSLIRAMLEDRSDWVRSRAAFALVRYVTNKNVEDAFMKLVAEERSTFVLQPVLQTLVDRITPDKIRKSLVTRLETEKDPMVKFVITDALEHRFVFDEDAETVLERLAVSPEAHVRMNALRLLGSKSEDPDIKEIFIKRLEEDPDVNVKYIALNAIGKYASDEDVRQALLTTMNSENNIGLVTVSINALKGQVSVPEVRKLFIVKLKQGIPNPVVESQLVGVLTKEIKEPEVRSVFLHILYSPNNPQVKSAVADAFADNAVKSDFDDFKALYIKESDKQLADKYFSILYKINPKAAGTLRKIKE